MNHSPHDDEQQLLRHVREIDQAQPPAALDAQILAAARQAAARQRPTGPWSRLRNWLADVSTPGRWSAAFGCIALLGLGLGLSLQTQPPTYDAPAPMLQRQMAPAAPAQAPLAEAGEAPKMAARMLSKALPPPLPDELVAELREIVSLRERGEHQAAEVRVQALHERYPDLDIEAQLARLPAP